MTLSKECIKALHDLLVELYGLDYTEAEAQDAGRAIIRFVVAKARRERELAEEHRKRIEALKEEMNREY